MSQAPRKDTRSASEKRAAPSDLPAPLAKVFAASLSPDEKRDRIVRMIKTTMPWNKKSLRRMFEQFAIAQQGACDKLARKEKTLRVSAHDIPLAEKLAQQQRIVKKAENMAIEAGHIRHRYSVVASALANQKRKFRGADILHSDFAGASRQIGADITRRDHDIAQPAREGIVKTRRQIRQQKKKAAAPEAAEPGELSRPITVGPPLRFRP